MLHAIGKTKKQRPEELVDLLLACHDRIRTFTDLAVEIGVNEDAPDESVLEGVARVRRYFSEALPLHEADEEEAILPRLYGYAHEIDVALERMRREHDLHHASVRRLLRLCGVLTSSPGDAPARIALAAAAQHLRATFGAHLEAEERVIFPAIRSRLPIQQQHAIVREIRARRQPP